MKRVIILILVLTSGCRQPDYITSHGVRVFQSCADSEYGFPAQDEIEQAIDFFIENVDVEHELTIWRVLLTAELELQCTPWMADYKKPDGTIVKKVGAGYHKTNLYRLHWVDTLSYISLFHEFYHKVLKYQTGSQDTWHTENSDKWMQNRELSEQYLVLIGYRS